MGSEADGMLMKYENNKRNKIVYQHENRKVFEGSMMITEMKKLNFSQK